MSQKIFDLAKGSPDQRKGIEQNDLIKLKQEIIFKIAEAIIDLRDLNYLSGKLLRDDFIQTAMKKAREIENEDIETIKKNACFYRPKVWLKNGPENSCELKWEKIYKSDKNGDGSLKKKFRASNFTLNSTAFFGVNNYYAQPKWAQASIKKTEQQFRLLRESNDVLTSILQSLFILSKNVDTHYQKNEDVLNLLEELGIPSDEKAEVLTRAAFSRLVKENHKEDETVPSLDYLE